MKGSIERPFRTRAGGEGGEELLAVLFWQGRL